jgi:hypothetical protein
MAAFKQGMEGIKSTVNQQHNNSSVNQVNGTKNSAHSKLMQMRKKKKTPVFGERDRNREEEKGDGGPPS